MCIYFYGRFSVFTMESDPFSKGNSLGTYYMFYSVPALFSHNRDHGFGTVIAESKNKLIIVDNESNREHVYSIPKSRVDHYGDQRMYFNVPESSLKEFEI